MVEALDKSPGNATYYVDSSTGDDRSNGISSRTPWKSLFHVNKAVFAPGDRILLKAGTSYSGRLYPHGSGTEDQPIVVDMYGEGAKPCINGQGDHLETILLHNQEYWEINNLEITNTGKMRASGRYGVRISVEDFGTAHHIHLRNLFIHDVNGSNVKKEGGGGGIVWKNYGNTIPSRFDGLIMEGCHLLRTDRNGIVAYTNHWKRNKWFPSLNVVIRNNLLEDIGGDGIVPIGTEGCLIQGNRLDGGRQRCQDYAAGIWPWSCDNTVIQFNEVSRMKGTKDGQAFDSDDNCINTLFQYNYSHDNEGGFMLVCSCGDAESNSAWLKDTIIRHNISQNDGARLFHIGGPVRDIYIYNNTFYVGKNLDIYAVLQTEDEGWPDNTHFYNNIFYVEGSADYSFGKSTNYIFSNNVFYGNHRNLPCDREAITADPMLIAPGRGGEGFGSLDGYHLRPKSPCIGAGMFIKGHGCRDFWGNSLPDSTKPDIGAHLGFISLV